MQRKASVEGEQLMLIMATGSGQVLGILKRGQHPHLSRFYSHLEKLSIIQQVLGSINTAKQKKVGFFQCSMRVKRATNALYRLLLLKDQVLASFSTFPMLQWVL